MAEEFDVSLLKVGSPAYGTVELVVSLRLDRNILYKLVCTPVGSQPFEIYPTLNELYKLGVNLISISVLAKDKDVLDKSTFEHIKFLIYNLTEKTLKNHPSYTLPFTNKMFQILIRKV